MPGWTRGYFVERPKWGLAMKFTIEHTSGAYGTDQLITVSCAGVVIGQADPFWPAGIPVDPRERERRIRATAKRIIAEYAK